MTVRTGRGQHKIIPVDPALVEANREFLDPPHVEILLATSRCASYREIMKMLKLRRGTVKSRLSRAKVALRELQQERTA